MSTNEQPKSGLKAPSKISRPSSGIGGGGIPKLTTSTTSTSKLGATTGSSTSLNLNNPTHTNETIAAEASQSANKTEESQFQLEERVFVNGTKPGRLAFIGETQFKEGIWAGVVLDTLEGKNNGSVGGVQYFECGGEMRGVFCRLNKLSRSFDPSLSGQASAGGAGGDSNATATATSAAVTTGSSSAIETAQSASGFKIGDRVVISSAVAGGVKVGTLKYDSFGYYL
jgi:hypothetical protein